MRVILWLAVLATLGTTATAQRLNAVRAPERPQPEHSYFGASIAVDGTHLLIGAPGESTGTLTRHGAAYLFQPDPSERLIQRLTASDATIFDSFGAALALDAGRAVIGAPGHWGGAAYVFHATEAAPDGAWAEFQRLTADDGAALNAQFGTALALDGTTLLVGAPAYGDERSGAVFVYDFDGQAWSQTERWELPEANNRTRFGSALALDGDWALVGAPGADGAVENSGTVYVYHREDGSWMLDEELRPSGLGMHELFGSSVALDGDRALVGSLMHRVEEVGPSGAAFVFDRTEAEGWQESGRLTAPDARRNDYFGHQVSVRGGHLAVSAPRAEKDDRRDVGAIYLFEFAEAAWRFLHRVEHESQTQEHTFFGGAMVLTDEFLYVGSHLENDAGSDTGNAYSLALSTLVGTEGAEASADVAFSYAFHPPGPNPFRGEARLRFDLPEASRVRVSVHDVLGREVAIVAEGAYAPGREQEVVWRPGGLGAGVYFIRFEANKFQKTQRVVLVK